MINNLFLLGGLPRSGITVLSSLLNQNPNLYVTTTSPFVEILWRNYSMWDDSTYDGELDADKMQNLKTPFLNNVTKSFYSELTKAKNVIDKRRQWQGITNIEMYKEIYGELPKIICPVRDIDEIIVSYMQIFESNDIKWDYDKLMKGNRFETSYYQLKETFESEYAECLHLVEYNDLVDNPQETLDGIYNFLGLPSFNHSLNIKATEKEANHGLVGLHTLRPTLSRDDTKSKNYLTDLQTENYNKKIFWRN
jgi:sulfotransferase